MGGYLDQSQELVKYNKTYCPLSRGAYRVVMGKPVGKRPLGRPRHRWKDI
jgi:hypothetical protein